MGKEYRPFSNDATDHVVYNLFKNCANAKLASNLDFNIQNLNTLNQWAILEYSRNLAKANMHLDIVNKLDEKIEMFEEKFTFMAPTKFDPKLENRSMATVLKIAGLVIAIGLVTFALTREVQIPKHCIDDRNILNDVICFRTKADFEQCSKLIKGVFEKAEANMIARAFNYSKFNHSY